MLRAVSRVLNMLGADAIGVGLGQGESRPTKTFDVIRAALVTAVTLCAVLLGVHFYLSARRADAARETFLTAKDSVGQQAATLLLKLETTYFRDAWGLSPAEAALKAKEVVENIPRDERYVIAVHDQLARRYRELQIEWGVGKEIPPIESALKVWVEIYTALNGIDRRSLGWFRITKLNITQTQATLAIELDNDAVIDIVATALVNNDYLIGRAKNPKLPLRKGVFAKNKATGRYSGTIDMEFGGS